MDNKMTIADYHLNWTKDFAIEKDKLKIKLSPLNR